MGHSIPFYNFVHRVAHQQFIYFSLNKGGFPLLRNVLRNSVGTSVLCA